MNEQVDEYVSVLASELSELLRKARCWDDFLSARSADDGWKELVRRGDVIAAIKECRSLHGYGLREAKDVVERFRRGGAA